MLPTTLQDWLSLLEARHSKAIDLGLERVGQVAERMGVRRFSCPVITVAGTNGKGSTVTMLESLARTHDLRVGTYTSPHLLHFNERIRLNAENVSDEPLLQAFAAVESARAALSISLTYFEFTTLAAFWLFQQQTLDLLVLEVGMGGRLDAVNLIDADVAVITGIDLDHMTFLGNTREKIAFEKAGVCRAGKPVVLSDVRAHDVCRPAVLARGAQVFAAGDAFSQHTAVNGELLWTQGGHTLALGVPQLGADLVAGALMAFRLALPGLWRRGAVRAAVIGTGLAGRWQQIAALPLTVLDVAHNPQAMARLVARAQAQDCRQWHVVLGMLADKDLHATLACWRGQTARFYLADLPPPRGARGAQLAAALPEECSAKVFADLATALRAAQSFASVQDGILVCGSFVTVAAALAAVKEVG